MKSTASTRNREAGFSLIEIMLSMSLLAIILITLAAWTFQIARGSIASSAAIRRTAEMNRVVGRLTVLPYDSLPTHAGCQTDHSVVFPHMKCVSVTDLSTRVRRVQILITPLNTLYRPDTVIVNRTKAAAANPFNT